MHQQEGKKIYGDYGYPLPKALQKKKESYVHPLVPPEMSSVPMATPLAMRPSQPRDSCKGDMPCFMRHFR